MKSPITGKEMLLVKNRKMMEFRRESFEIVCHNYLCQDSGEYFTSNELDELNMNQVYNQYRDKHHIPFPGEIKKIREKYGLSAAKMSEILGFGANTYRLYESGEIPSSANAKLIRMVDDPKNFIEILELCDTLHFKDKVKYIEKAKLLLDKEDQYNMKFKSYLQGNLLADSYSGYRSPDLDKFAEMVMYFSQQLKPFKTQLNLMLFLADFLMFRRKAVSISGMRYKLLDATPAPFNFHSIYDYLASQDQIEIQTKITEEGFVAEHVMPKTNRPIRKDLFSLEELEVMEEVSEALHSINSNAIPTFSKEENLIESIEYDGFISYTFAFSLPDLTEFPDKPANFITDVK